MRTYFVNVNTFIHFQMLAFLYFFHRGKSTEADALERSFGEKRYDPIQATPPPPPLPSQYTQPSQPGSSSSLALHTHAKGGHGEGRNFRSWHYHYNRVILIKLNSYSS